MLVVADDFIQLFLYVEHAFAKFIGRNVLGVAHSASSRGLLRAFLLLGSESTVVVHFRDSTNPIRFSFRNLRAPHSLTDFRPGYLLVDNHASIVRLLRLRNSAASFAVNSLCCCAAVLLCCFLKFYHTYCRNVKIFLRI
jgi:hypothetical protein